MASATERLALAEAMNLHDERVVKAQQRFDAARAELERAEIDLKVKMQGRENFKRAVRHG